MNKFTVFLVFTDPKDHHTVREVSYPIQAPDHIDALHFAIHKAKWDGKSTLHATITDWRAP